jgi:divalent metal cation (Fe/Co/Zn/Cd) transporter
VGFLITSATIIAYESVINRTPHEPPWTLLVLGAIIMERVFFRVVLKRSIQTNSSLRADAWHHRSDAITSVAAFWEFQLP